MSYDPHFLRTEVILAFGAHVSIHFGARLPSNRRRDRRSSGLRSPQILSSCHPSGQSDTLRSSQRSSERSRDVKYLSATSSRSASSDSSSRSSYTSGAGTLTSTTREGRCASTNSRRACQPSSPNNTNFPNHLEGSPCIFLFPRREWKHLDSSPDL